MAVRESAAWERVAVAESVADGEPATCVRVAVTVADGDAAARERVAVAVSVADSDVKTENETEED